MKFKLEEMEEVLQHGFSINLSRQGSDKAWKYVCEIKHRKTQQVEVSGVDLIKVIGQAIDRVRGL